MNPLDIYQKALDAVNAAVLTDDFASYAALIDLPYLVETQSASFLITEAEKLRPTFVALCGGLKARGVTHYERVARAADYVARDRIEGWHHSHLLANGTHVAYPHASRHAIVRRGDRWLFSQASYDQLHASTWPFSEAVIFQHLNLPAPAGSGQ